jgi:muconolactone delta-isomerase
MRRRALDTFMVVCTFKPETVMDDVFAVVAEEQAQIRELEAEGRIGAIHLSMARRTVFLEIFATDADSAEQTVRTLPMSKWWDLDLYPTAPPVNPDGGS